MLASSKKCCEGDINCVLPKVLDEKTTNEINASLSECLGEELLVLIAVTKDGRSLRFLPYGESNISVHEEINDDATTELLEIYVEIPKIITQ